MDRRSFLLGSAAAAAGLSLAGLPGCAPSTPRAYRVGGKARMKLSWAPYELQLRHTFTVASYSRTTTPDVQVRIDYDGFTGYGEASMPPYLGQTVESVCAFLEKVDLGTAGTALVPALGARPGQSAGHDLYDRDRYGGCGPGEDP